MLMRLGVAGLMMAICLSAAVPANAWRGGDEVNIRSTPPGAEVYIDGQPVGVTPLALPVTCDDVVDRRYRITYQDCTPAEGILNARVAPGRVVGMAFTLGSTAIFQCPKYFVPLNVPLTGGSCGAGAGPAPGDGGAVLPPPQPIGRPSGAQPSGDLAEQLRILKDLNERGVISDAEYQREREKALGGL